MAVSRELVFRLADARISLQCGGCKGEAVLDMRGEGMPPQCPSCGAEFPKGTDTAVNQLRWASRASDSVMLRVYETDLEKIKPVA
jgi:hypothetical protein